MAEFGFSYPEKIDYERTEMNDLHFFIHNQTTASISYYSLSRYDGKVIIPDRELITRQQPVDLISEIPSIVSGEEKDLLKVYPNYLTGIVSRRYGIPRYGRKYLEKHYNGMLPAPILVDTVPDAPYKDIEDVAASLFKELAEVAEFLDGWISNGVKALVR